MVALKPTPDHASWSDLIAGIVTDATHLFHKEVELARIEIRNDIRNVKALLTGIVIGGIRAVLGLGLLGIASALALFTYTTLPQWACFGVVGGVMLVAGVCFIAAVNRSKKRVDLIPSGPSRLRGGLDGITSRIRTSNTISIRRNKLKRAN